MSAHLWSQRSMGTRGIALTDSHKGLRKSECELDSLWSEKIRFAKL